MAQSNFNAEEQLFIRNNVKGKPVAELTKLFNNNFNKNIGENQIRNFKKKYKLKSGIDMTFKKGQVPHNYRPIGSEFVGNDGYTYIKIEDPNKWQQKQRYIYEKHKGVIPKGYSVVFADSDKTNFNIDNLILVRDKDKLVAKNKHLLFEDAELTKTGLLIAKLNNKIYEISK